MKARLYSGILVAVFAALCAVQTVSAQVTVLTVPWVPASPTTPHTTYPINPTTEASIILMATVPSAVGSTDSFTVTWSFGDASPNVSFALTNPYDISTTHQYPPSAATGTQWMATVTVNDTTNSTSGSANYNVIQEANVLSSRVNVAIDWGLAYLHRTMWRNGTNPNTSTAGGWDLQTYPCPTVGGLAYACTYPGVINAENVQAYEVSGHLATGPASDPYTDDVARGTARMLIFLASQGNFTTTYNQDPSKVNYGCSDGSQVQTNGACLGTATKVLYTPGSTACPSPPCTYTYDGNSDGMMIYSADGSGEPIYTAGPFIDALVASGSPGGIAPTGGSGVAGESYTNIVQNMADWYSACQYGYDVDPGNPTYVGYTRGGGYSESGGGWLYSCQQGDDNSTSQWAAIGLIAANRGFNLNTSQVVKDMNNVWVTNSQDVTSPMPTGTDPFASGDNYGAFGYRGSFAYSNAWGPFAVTPSGMVQMALDGVGRTTNTAFGDASSNPDQRWNDTETFMADNFCNSPASGAYYSPRAYLYGMFSFTKGMLLHDPGNTLSPIQFLRTLTPNVFTGNTSVPPNSIDWYAALSPANGGSDACDGVAQTLVGYQLPDGHWYGHDYDQAYQGAQSPFETAWAIIMLRRTVFVTCVQDLSGQGSSSGAAPARIDLSWTNQANSTSYDVLRSTTNGGPYTLVGTTSSTAFSDRSGLTNGVTYYYVVQPLNGSSEVCQSNQATITVPKLSGRH